MTKCTTPTCRSKYDETDPEEIKHHTEPVYCEKTSKRCTRCNGRPACYFCGDSFCLCHDH